MITMQDLQALGEKFSTWKQAHPPGSAAAHAYHMCIGAVVQIEQRELGDDRESFHDCMETIGKFRSLQEPNLIAFCFCGKRWVFDDNRWQQRGEPS